MAGKAQSRTPYAGKHSDQGVVKQSKRVGGEREAYGDGSTRGGAKGPLAPASEHGGSLKRKGKHELHPYGGDCCDKK
jgi:hypothetical protein